MQNNDKITELQRYSARSQALLNRKSMIVDSSIIPHRNIPVYFLEPYMKYDFLLLNYIKASSKVLELGAGDGAHTKVLLDTGANVIASDLSAESLEVLKLRYKKYDNLKTAVADIEYLPFEDNEFDLVCCAGSLSYGSPNLVDFNIMRVIKPGGIFICVDSLNHNLLYRFNRWLHYLRGNRTKSTLANMPTIDRISYISSCFEDSNVYYSGSVAYMLPFIAWLFGNKFACRFSNLIDRSISVRKSAFKFVLCARGLKK